MSSDSMVSVCSSGGSQHSAAGDAGTDRRKKPKVWVSLAANSEGSVMQLIKGKCLPILLYAVETYPSRKLTSDHLILLSVLFS